MATNNIDLNRTLIRRIDMNQATLGLHEYFVNDQKKHIHREIYGDDGWKTIKRKLNMLKVEDHLNHNRLVGVFQEVSYYFLIDIDGHFEAALATIKDRVDRIISIFPKAPLKIQSSGSKGIHLYYFLDAPYDVDVIQKAVEFQLNKNGIYVKDGDIEIFPKMNKGHRLPFGLDSYIVDDDLNPIIMNYEEAINIFLEYARM